jgi:hypothetical protein
MPDSWSLTTPSQVDDGGLPIAMTMEHPTGVFAGGVKALVEHEREEERSSPGSFDRVRLAPDVLLQVPPPWHAAELEAVMDGGVVGSQVMRIAIVARDVPGGFLVASVLYPPTLADHVSPTIAGVLRSARLP